MEVFTFSALRQTWKEAIRDFEREHTTPFLWEHPERFRIANVRWETGTDYSMTHRWTIDYPEDYEFIRTVYDYLWKKDRPVFFLQDILDLVDTHPELAKINEKYRGVNWYRNHLESLRIIAAEQTRISEAELV